LKPDALLASPSPRLLAAARRYLRRYTARHFNSLRIASDGPAPTLDGPTIFYANHPSWWDPIVMLLLIRTHYSDWRFQGPIDAVALKRYPWLERLGLFGIELDSLRGARRFLAIGDELLAGDRTGLAMTAQGQFADTRQRPLELKRGLSQLLRRNPSARAIPLALEYVYWNERLPEILVRFGRSPVSANGRSTDAIHADLEASLERELDQLTVAAIARDPAAFDSLLAGRGGVGWLQDLPFRLRALFKGERFDPSHQAIGRNAG
jgi:hypothetical protein